MGRLTEEMRRLAEEIAELHASRGKFMQDLSATVLGIRTDVSALRSRFHHAHAEMTDAARAARWAFVSGVVRTADDLQRGFREEREEMGRRTNAERSAFLSGVNRAVAGLKQSVATLRHEFSADLLGAHQAWSGSFLAPSKKRGDSPHHRARGK